MRSKDKMKHRGPSSPRRAADSLRGVDYQALAQLQYQLRTCQCLGAIAPRQSKLTPQQRQALLAIKGFSQQMPVSIGDLARLLLVRHHTAVERMDRMTRLKLIERTPDPDNGRRVLVRLTARGEHYLRRSIRIHVEELGFVKETLTRILRDVGLSSRR